MLGGERITARLAGDSMPAISGEKAVWDSLFSDCARQWCPALGLLIRRLESLFPKGLDPTS
jgi:hypothetical protein